MFPMLDSLNRVPMFGGNHTSNLCTHAFSSSKEENSFTQNLRAKDLSKGVEEEIKELKNAQLKFKAKSSHIIRESLVSVSMAERLQYRLKVLPESNKFGHYTTVQRSSGFAMEWEDGPLLKAMDKRIISVQRDIKAIELQLKEKAQATDDILQQQLSRIKTLEAILILQRNRNEVEKLKVMSDIALIHGEDRSLFNNFPILNNRYCLLNMLGKGGFGEVYKAFDLDDLEYVACKLHGLNACSDRMWQQYMKYALREYEIQSSLMHPNIVSLRDIFKINEDVFCTVLDYCSGKDLDAFLKERLMLPEHEARLIIIQVFKALVYLNTKDPKIIHFDLKPANIIFDDLGMAKLSDFGISKIQPNNLGLSDMELTSPKSGTFWYLPPECFEFSKTILISSKVDVWSAGVIFYQMLFGRRPFGHDQTSDMILREQTILKASSVNFPSSPAVSKDAKNFIRRCLTYNKSERPNVLTISQDTYLDVSKKEMDREGEV